ncbi:MAG: aminotransferase class IV [Bacteroidales bacterium]|jgi:branched-chain amino acid aminotransferase|nr:aminotransferase class IV [Bacteroidales bacterium]
MIPNCISTYVSVDFEFQRANSIIIPESEKIIYDIIRIQQSIPLFWEEHINRFLQSLSLANVPHSYTLKGLHRAIMEFIERENIVEGNIRISCNCYSHYTQLFIYQIKHSYPDKNMYENGVSSDLLYAERSNPKVKQELPVREIANIEIQKRQLYDIVLVDSSNNIREGSRTNIFFVDSQSNLVTAPEQDVLNGISRKKIIEIAHILHIPVFEKKISAASLPEYTSAFFTGTSPRILPIKSIGTQTFSVDNSIIQSILKTYNSYIEQYIINQKTQKSKDL